jgi:hypothetical protein
MLRAKIALTFVALMSLLLGGVYVVMQHQIGSALEKDAESALRRAATIEEQSMRLDEFALIAKAEFTASNRQLYKRMNLDEDQELYEQLSEKYLQARNPVDVRHLAVYDEPLTVDKIRLQDTAKRTQGSRNLDLGLYERRPAPPDLFLILDKNGKGVAALGKDNYNWYGDNVAEQFPSVLATMKDNQVRTAIWNWAWNQSDDHDLYRVAIAPIRPTRHAEPAGVVVTGNVVSDGVAKDSQRLMAGVTTEGDDLATVDRLDLDKAPEVAFIRGESIVASTFSSKDEERLEGALFEDENILEADEPEKLFQVEVDGRPYFAITRFLAGEFGGNDDPTGFVVLSNVDEARAPVASSLTNIVFLGGGLLLLGVILMLFFIHKFLRPGEEIEQGIGEVLAGNKDYTFELREDHPVFSSLAQGLNLMSAFLQGKPMPDDVEEMEGWGELISDGGAPSSGGASKVQGVAMPGMGGAKKDEPEEDSADGDDEASS